MLKIGSMAIQSRRRHHRAIGTGPQSLTLVRHASQFVPSMFIAQLPQMPSLRARRGNLYSRLNSRPPRSIDSMLFPLPPPQLLGTATQNPWRRRSHTKHAAWNSADVRCPPQRPRPTGSTRTTLCNAASRHRVRPPPPYRCARLDPAGFDVAHLQDLLKFTLWSCSSLILSSTSSIMGPQLQGSAAPYNQHPSNVPCHDEQRKQQQQRQEWQGISGTNSCDSR